MLRLNMRITQPMIGLHTQLGKLEAHSTPAKLHTENRQASSTVHWTQTTLEINQYPSRHAYGFVNHTDFAREHGQQGYSDLKETTERWTSEAWDNIENGGKPGRHPVTQRYDSKLQQEISRQRHVVTELIPDPEIHITPGQVTGDVDRGDVTEKIEAESFAQTHFTPGQVETYLKQKPDIRRWVTEGKYDIYA